MRSRTLLAAASLAMLPMFAFGNAHFTQGEVRKVDKEAGKITLKHGEIRNLEMPPMTMTFRVKDRAQLDKVKQGDKVRFTAEKVGSTYTVTLLEPAKP
jgi:Cu/Ag efflux protein CusF